MSQHASPEQRYRAVLAVQSGAPVAEVARRNGISRQTLHNWRRRYRAAGRAGLADRSRRPHRSPSRLDPRVEEMICALRVQHPDWGAQRLRVALSGSLPAAPSRTTVHRVLVRNNLLSAGGASATARAGKQAGTLTVALARHARRGEPEERWLTDLLGTARELIDRLNRVIDFQTADPGRSPAPGCPGTRGYRGGGKPDPDSGFRTS